MDVIPGNIPLCKLFTTSFRTRNGIAPESINKLVEKIQEVTVFIHDKKCLIVDGNEMNYLADNKTFTIPYFIDVNSYATPSFPATVIMPSIKDWKTNGFNTLTDWYSFAVVSFQLFVGIHPFKGNYPKFVKLDPMESMKKRILANISVLNPEVSVPPSVRDFSYIPSEFMGWYVKVFEKGERIPPPQVAGILNVKQVKISVVQSTNNFIIQIVKEYSDEIVRARYWNGVGSITTKKEVFINKANYPISSPRGLDIIFTPKMMAPILARIQDDFLTLFVVPSKEKIETGIQATDKLVVGNTLYVKNEGNLLELVMNEIGGKIVPSVKTCWNIMPKSSLIFNGVIYQNVLGKAYLVIPRPEVGRNSSCHIIETSELDGYKIIDSKHENRICMVSAVKGTETTKFVFTFDPTFSSYDYRLVQDDQLINFVVLDNGVCVSINNDDSIEVFRNTTPNKVQKIKDPDINATFTLTYDGVKVLFFRENILYSLSMKK
jgi:hypothetical protein